MREREERIKAGLDVADLDSEEEEEEDYMGVGPLLERLEKEEAKGEPSNLNMYEEPTDSESESDDEEAMRIDMFEKKLEKHEELLYKFTKAGM